MCPSFSGFRTHHVRAPALGTPASASSGRYPLVRDARRSGPLWLSQVGAFTIRAAPARLTTPCTALRVNESSRSLCWLSRTQDPPPIPIRRLDPGLCPQCRLGHRCRISSAVATSQCSYVRGGASRVLFTGLGVRW
ncbi:hypothetical protein NDU88_005678 [Pleurodeles waltl]|uniref:Uncharacterized protein n=1 Tax=Pleurodeles waltl TaxID=8319 RepID=A0AAV7NVX9_PLEWA|nr:hypothetical protein NDU88_005678 [Pleurodeles waltl]